MVQKKSEQTYDIYSILPKVSIFGVAKSTKSARQQFRVFVVNFSCKRGIPSQTEALFCGAGLPNIGFTFLPAAKPSGLRSVRVVVSDGVWGD